MYYPRFGYIPASNLGIQAPFDVPDDAFMVKQLVVNTDISGAVKYPNEFFSDCACLFSKRNTDITSNIAKYSIEFHFLQGRKGQQSIAVKSFYDNYCSYCTMQN